MQPYQAMVKDVYENKVLKCSKCSGLSLTCKCRVAFEILCSIISANIPYNFRFAKTDQYVLEKNASERKQIEKYIKNIRKIKQEGWGLHISGGPLTGKTLLICAVLISAIKSKLTAYYIELSDYFQIQELKYSADESDRNHHYNVTKKLKEAAIVAIDGIGTGIQGAKPASRQSVTDLFKERTNAGLPTIIGTNDKEDALKSISSEFPVLVNSGCPIVVRLSTVDEYIASEILKKQSAFDDMPE